MEAVSQAASPVPSHVRPRAIVAGAGPAGAVAALGLAAAGAQVALLAPDRPADTRTTALMDGSVRVLEALGVWERLRPRAAPLRVMRIIDGTRRLVRAPEVAFRASEASLEAFAWNVENADLNAALDATVAATPGISRITGTLADFEVAPEGLHVETEDGARLEAALLVAADGRQSRARQIAGIEMRSRAYPQVAVTATLAHERPHGNISTEFHTETGPFTLVPLPGERSSVVCVVSPEEAERLQGLDDGAFGREMERRSASILGRMRLESPRGAFPLSARTARRLSAPRLVLAGEAAHVIPPIGAQGLNLGIRDAATLADLVADAVRAGADIGGAQVSEGYERRRRGDIDGRTLAVDLVNRSLLSDLVPVQGLRGLGLWLLGKVPGLRLAAMRQGVGPTRDIPRLAAGKPL
ncbi:UbiH/UbiF family hydroxylase [Ancylobacter sp. 6x-1]|uniref:UbiH/UbiF family hydroxylase n=1 Tax=Ancylobacter crimeensis TaxID=2579147 RepID=A0ABT0DCJ3_9HYPH|nr:UbiH/UbiF family hydroxylase [Ancylobacter crimeensis]MCK0197669.1 UbiH/UbiF family hydroxylase [Ancylobacter crimeensis]